MIPAPDGGAFLAWWDQRDSASTDWDIYAQRIDASGAPVWATDGVPVCTALGEQTVPHLAADGAGGVIVLWSDLRSGTHWDNYAQRLSAEGNPQWQANGVKLRWSSNDQYLTGRRPCIVSDGVGGAIIVWYERITGYDTDIYAQRINAAGVLQWTGYGIGVCAVPGLQWYPTLASDGSGGAIVVWEDWRDSPRAQIFAQRVDSSGASLWGVDGEGMLIGQPGGDQRQPSVVSDGTGGAYAVWCGISPILNYGCDIYAQRMDSDGGVYWQVGGIPICTAYNHQDDARVARDGNRGAIVCWYDVRTEPDYSDIYAQYVDTAGVTKWIENGVPVCTAPGQQLENAPAPDGRGGAFVVWRDGRSALGPDIYAQHLDPLGNPQWMAGGMPLGTATDKTEWGCSIVSDVPGEAIVAWSDNRDGTDPRFPSRGEYYTNLDIYATRLTAEGVVGVRDRSSSSVTPLRVYPNPSRGGSVTIAFGLSLAQRPVVEVLGLRGERVRALPTGELGVGNHTLSWDGKDDQGRRVPAGIYLVRLLVAGRSISRKVLWMK